MPVSARAQKILAVLDEFGGTTSADAAAAAKLWGGYTDRAAGARCRQFLMLLEGKGLVRRLDNEKPTAWCRTHHGTIEAGLGDLP